MSGRAHLLLGMSYASNDAKLLSICLLPRVRLCPLPMRVGLSQKALGFTMPSLSRLIATF
jgi:hypothetical protein